MRRLCVAAVALVLLGCSALDLPPMESVQIGMSDAEVVSVLGKPERIDAGRAQDGPIVWYYNVGVVILQDGRVAYTYPLPTPRI